MSVVYWVAAWLLVGIAATFIERWSWPGRVLRGLEILVFLGAWGTVQGWSDPVVIVAHVVGIGVFTGVVHAFMGLRHLPEGVPFDVVREVRP